MFKRSYYIINAITVYRALAAFVLLGLIITGNREIFKWLLAFSFFTDAIDGLLARKYKVSSVLGSRIDSIADDLTILMAIIGLLIFEPGFVQHQLEWIISLLSLYMLQNIIAFIRYGRISSFHTYLAKLATILQGIFLILIFFLPDWPLGLFHLAAIVTILDLAEEIVLVIIIHEWKSDVKGLYWIEKK
ncbi:MAG: CDP-alcohol phosphatidyltransferase family protein [Flavisolibacter sp.]